MDFKTQYLSIVLKGIFIFPILQVYVWSKQNPFIHMSFLGLFNFTAAYLPWVSMLLVFMLLNYFSFGNVSNLAYCLNRLFNCWILISSDNMFFASLCPSLMSSIFPPVSSRLLCPCRSKCLGGSPGVLFLLKLCISIDISIYHLIIE